MKKSVIKARILYAKYELWEWLTMKAQDLWFKCYEKRSEYRLFIEWVNIEYERLMKEAENKNDVWTEDNKCIHSEDGTCESANKNRCDGKGVPDGCANFKSKCKDEDSCNTESENLI